LERVKKDLLETHSVTKTQPPVVLALDLSDVNKLPEKIQQVLEIFGHIDILVNNGGISVRSSALDTSIDVDMRIMAVNYFGTVALTKAVLPSMIKRKEGRIICISSVQGKFAIPHRSAYSASKHALQAFCDSLRAEVAEHNVKVTVISPGYINTALSLNALTGSGSTYGILDGNTAAGADPYKVSQQILRSVLNDDKDVILSSLAPKVAYYLRILCPSLYFWIMNQRALKLQKKDV
jgi:dehydrogenase/reductase SDR family protein 7B